jgi:hypothetical protein
MEEGGAGLGMNLREELLSSAAALIIFQLKDGFRVAAHLADIESKDICLAVETRFLRLWDYMARQNAMFSNPYNMKGLI